MSGEGPLLDEVRRLRRARRHGEALARLAAAGDAARSDPRLGAERVRALVGAGRRTEAGREAEALLAEHPRSVAVWLAACHARHAAGKHADARDAAARAVDLWAGGPSLYALARAELRCGRPAEALDAARRGIELDPKDRFLRGCEAEALAALGRSEAAGRAAEAGAAAGPGDAYLRQRALETKLAGLDEEEAVAELRALAALPEEGGRAEVHLVLGKRLYHARRWEEAAPAFERALAIDPGDRYARRFAGFARNKAGQPARAAALLRPAFLADPHDQFTRTTFLAACRKAGDLDGLRATIDEAIAAHPDAPFLHGLRRKHAPDPRPPGGEK